MSPPLNLCERATFRPRGRREAAAGAEDGAGKRCRGSGRAARTGQGRRRTPLEDIYVSVAASRRLTKSGGTCLERRTAAIELNQAELTPPSLPSLDSAASDKSTLGHGVCVLASGENLGEEAGRSVGAAWTQRWTDTNFLSPLPPGASCVSKNRTPGSPTPNFGESSRGDSRAAILVSTGWPIPGFGFRAREIDPR
ncbi:hypothetical protein KM043_008156 [Ampulex compressa]|nr:hypothetical protein KM043_008156 [Ampulex compressa]